MEPYGNEAKNGSGSRADVNESVPGASSNVETYTPPKLENDSSDRGSGRGPFRAAAMMHGNAFSRDSYALDNYAGGLSAKLGRTGGSKSKPISVSTPLMADAFVKSSPVIRKSVEAGVKYTEQTRVTVAAAPAKPAANLKKLEEGYFVLSNVVKILPEHGCSPETIAKVWTVLEEAVKAEGGELESTYKKNRRRGNLITSDFDACSFDLQVLMLEKGDVKQLAVEMKRSISYTGRIAFIVLHQKVAWDLRQAGLSKQFANGQEIFRPTKDIQAEMDRENRTEDMSLSDDSDDLCMPTGTGQSSTGFRLDKHESKDLLKCWTTMYANGSCPGITKMVARASERECNAQIIGGNNDLMKHVIKSMRSGGPKTRNQQIILCTTSTVSKAIPFMDKSLLNSELVDSLADNLVYFGMAEHLRCKGIQDAVIRCLQKLASATDLETLMSKKARDVFNRIVTKKALVGNADAHEKLARLCSAMNAS